MKLQIALIIIYISLMIAILCKVDNLGKELFGITDAIDRNCAPSVNQQIN